MKRAGASANAYTSDDRTVYHEVFSKENLEEVMKLEADRLLRLKYPLPQYKTGGAGRARGVQQEQHQPIRKLNKLLRATAFKKHTYSRTMMGFLKDIKDMPNQYEYNLEFYSRYCRPEYTTLVLVAARRSNVN